MAVGPQIIVEGVDDLRKVLDRLSDEAKKELEKSLKKCAILVQGSAKKKAPRDTSNYGDSITYQVQGDEAIVGTTVKYGPYLEYGTGRLSDHPSGGKSGHAPFSKDALNNLEKWAHRHGMEPADKAARAIAVKIWKRGGLKPQPHFRPAMIENKKEIEEILGEAVRMAIKSVVPS